MREIKFRGLSVRTGEWLYGSLLTMNNKTYIEESKYGDLDDIDFGYGFEEVVLETVGQFTGLKDKNGVEVYDGDVVHDHASDAVGYVFFGNTIRGDTLWFRCKGQNCPMFSFDSINLEIVGNIHENKELLNER